MKSNSMVFIATRINGRAFVKTSLPVESVDTIKKIVRPGKKVNG